MLFTAHAQGQPVLLCPKKVLLTLRACETLLLESEHCLRMQGRERELFSHF